MSKPIGQATPTIEELEAELEAKDKERQQALLDKMQLEARLEYTTTRIAELEDALEAIVDTPISLSEQVNHLTLKHVVLYAQQALHNSCGTDRNE